MFPGETLLSGAPTRCDRCGLTPDLQIYESRAGFYIGTWCYCGPYSRESGYYPTREAAEQAFRAGPEVYRRR